MTKSGEPTAIYKAPVWEWVSKTKRKVTGFRLTNPLPCEGGQLRYYLRKGYVLATEQDVEELGPATEEE